MSNHYDFIIVGGGAAGFSAATRAEELGIRTLMINGGDLPIGGTCVNVGCVPSKILIEIGNQLYNRSHSNYDLLKDSHTEEVDYVKAVEEKDGLVNALRQSNYMGFCCNDCLDRFKVHYKQILDIGQKE